LKTTYEQIGKDDVVGRHSPCQRLSNLQPFVYFPKLNITIIVYKIKHRYCLWWFLSYEITSGLVHKHVMLFWISIFLTFEIDGILWKQLLMYINPFQCIGLNNKQRYKMFHTFCNISTPIMVL
jgi:hypothetical protein